MSIVSKNEYWKHQAGQKKDKGSFTIQTATVTQLNPAGEAIIRFAGDSQPSQKIYKRVKNYTPAVGDRVMLINNIIIGGWRP